MLTIEECRKLIPDSRKLTDKEIEEIRNDLSELAEIALDSYIQSKSNKGG